MDGVVDKNDVLIAINKVHDRLCGVAAKKMDFNNMISTTSSYI